MKIRRFINIAAILLLLSGLAFFFYPAASNILYNHHSKTRTDQFQLQTSQEPADTKNDLYEKMQAYNQELFESRQQKLKDPFSFGNVDFSLLDFGFDEEMIGYLEIPKMDIRLPVYLGASEENLKKGAAHLTQTSLPVGGTNTNAVIAAHRGYSRAAMFRNIERLGPGDPVYLTTFQEQLTYRVAEIKIISPDDVDQILIQPDRDLITLLTCHPYRSNSQRYVVYCERVV